MSSNLSIKAIFRLILLVLSFASIVTGAVNGGYAESLYKSIGICWECIGLG